MTATRKNPSVAHHQEICEFTDPLAARAYISDRHQSPFLITNPHGWQVGGFKTGKSTFTKMLKTVFAARAGCTTSCTDFTSDVCTVISFVDPPTGARHTFEFKAGTLQPLLLLCHSARANEMLLGRVVGQSPPALRLVAFMCEPVNLSPRNAGLSLKCLGI